MKGTVEPTLSPTGWWHQQNFGLFDRGAAFTAHGLLESDGLHLSVKDKSPLIGGTYLEGFKLGSEGEGDATRLSRNKPMGGKPESEVKSATQLKCMYTNTFSMGNKQEELEAMVLQESYDFFAITEMWWMTHITGVLHWMATSSSEETGKGEGVEGGGSVY